ncbi:phage DNA encapsidation protein [Muribaculum intestinale]|uniref:phage DNA encapsidation protein n=1 Tax=Muribaculum intestinale TaxID=1796646 RepID=UPI0025B70A38|nr:phage DNA encapsidation protein [Muribaculum intestinale]
MGLYLDNGYLDIEWILSRGYPFNFITSGRGTGKTYGAIKSALLRSGSFMYLRRTVAQADMVATSAMSPLSEVALNLGLELKIESLGKNLSGVWVDEQLRGYIYSLSTMANMRGFHDPQLTTIIYDEFIPQAQERRIKNEGEAWLNAYETLNRNRELNGADPIQAVLLSNSNQIVNPLYVEFQLVSVVERMLKKKREVWTDEKRGYMLVYPMRSEISRAKSSTALYQFSGDSEYRQMALSNEFNDWGSEYIKSQPLREYTPECRLGELTVYVHKDKGCVYISEHSSGTVRRFPATVQGVDGFRRRYRWVLVDYLDGRVIFENAMCEALFRYYLLKT